MSPMTTTKISNSTDDQRETLEAEVRDDTVETKERRVADTPTTTRRDYKTKLAGSKATVTSPGTKIINDTAYHDARISGSDLILENFNEIDYASPGVVQLTTTAFKGAIITGGRISSGARAAPRNLA